MTATSHNDQLGEIYPTMLIELNCTFGVGFSSFHCCGFHGLWPPWYRPIASSSSRRLCLGRPVERREMGSFPGSRDVLGAPPSLKNTEKGVPDGFFLTIWPQICIKSIFGRGSAPDPAGRAYDAPPDPYSRMVRGHAHVSSLSTPCSQHVPKLWYRAPPEWFPGPRCGSRRAWPLAFTRNIVCCCLGLTLLLEIFYADCGRCWWEENVEKTDQWLFWWRRFGQLYSRQHRWLPRLGRFDRMYLHQRIHNVQTVAKYICTCQFYIIYLLLNTLNSEFTRKMYFDFKLPNEIIPTRIAKFMSKSSNAVVL